MPKTVLITGAQGNIGKKLQAHLQGGYQLKLLDTASGGDPSIVIQDLSKWDDRLTELFREVDLVVHLAGDPYESSNGIVWTSESKLVYYIDTVTGSLDVFDFDLDTGAIKNRRSVLKNEWGGCFDGMTIDAEDNLYIAIWQGGAVYKIDPKGGRILATIKVPGVRNVMSCAFGGTDLNDLYITSAAKGTDPRVEPNAGALFKINLADTRGMPAFEFDG